MSDQPLPQAAEHATPGYVHADFARELERENARLRAIFPRILESLQSGACTPDCSVEFMEMIPNEVACVMRKLRNAQPPS